MMTPQFEMLPPVGARCVQPAGPYSRCLGLGDITYWPQIDVLVNYMIDKNTYT